MTYQYAPEAGRSPRRNLSMGNVDFATCRTGMPTDRQAACMSASDIGIIRIRRQPTPPVMKGYNDSIYDATVSMMYDHTADSSIEKTALVMAHIGVLHGKRPASKRNRS